MMARKPLRIWCVVVGEPSPVDGAGVRMLRTGLLARVLARRGHEVTWFNGTVEHRSKTQRFEENTVLQGDGGLTMAFLYGRVYQGNVSFARIGNNRDVAKSFLRMAKELPAPDVILCSYPPIELANAVRLYATARNIPYALDLRDMWPDIIADVAPKILRPLAKAAMAPWFSSARKSAAAAAGIVGISLPFLEWGLRMAGRDAAPRDRVFHLATDPETADAEALARANAYWDSCGLDGSCFTIVFSGMLSARYDLETVIRGALLLPDDLKARIRIVICGKGEAEDDLKALAGNASHVLFAGWRNLADLQSLMARAHAGLLPYFSTPDFVAAFPNKVGEYLASGLPILSCLEGEVRRLLETRDCGRMYGEGDPAGFAAALAQLASDPQRLSVMSAAARAVYAESFDAYKIYEDYADYAESLTCN